MRTRLLASFMFITCATLLGQSPDGDLPMSGEDSTAQLELGYGRYVSGFEILNRVKNPNELRFYPNRVLAKVRNRWYPQIRELRRSIGRKQGITIIEFEIKNDGSIGTLKTVESAHDSALNKASSEAVSSSAPFPPLPATYRDKTLKMRMQFGYDQPASSEAPSCNGPNWGAHTEARILRHAAGDKIAAPKSIYSPDPEYSEQARRKKYMSTVVLAGTVDPQGAFTDVCVGEAAGEGLDERAMEAVNGWRFEPATLEGQPLAVRIRVEVSFRLY